MIFLSPIFIYTFTNKNNLFMSIIASLTHPVLNQDKLQKVNVRTVAIIVSDDKTNEISCGFEMYPAAYIEDVVGYQNDFNYKFEFLMAKAISEFNKMTANLTEVNCICTHEATAAYRIGNPAVVEWCRLYVGGYTISAMYKKECEKESYKETFTFLFNYQFILNF